MSDSLKNKALRGISWSFVDNIASSGISFLVGLVLARILSPAEFGIIGMITIFIAISNSIVDSGFSNALIRKNDAGDIDYNTVFFFNIALGTVLYVILCLLSPLISAFFKEPLVIPITKVLGLILIINSLAIIQRTLLVKAVDFKTQMKVSLIASIISGIVGIGMALRGLGVWSLVGQQLSRQLLNTLFLWVFSKWRPAFMFSWRSFKELFGFGSKLLLSGLIDTVYKNIYYLIIGHFYSAYQLGQYTRASQFKDIFAINLTTVVQRVSYPVLSSIQDDEVRLKVAYRHVIRSTMLITFGCMLGLAAVAKALILVLIGNKWLEAVTYLQIICFSGMLYPLHAINLNILQVKGRSDLLLKLEIIKKMLAIIPIVLGVFFGIKFMLWGSVFNSFVAYYLNSRYSENLINYPTVEQVKDILPIFGISMMIALGMWSISFLPLNIYLMLTVQCLVGLLVACLIYEKVALPEYVEIRKNVFSLISRKKR